MVPQPLRGDDKLLRSLPPVFCLPAAISAEASRCKNIKLFNLYDYVLIFFIASGLRMAKEKRLRT